MIPTGMDVERLAISMASVEGIIWQSADQDTADLYRRHANAALIHMVGKDAPLTKALADGLLEAAEGAWAGARALEYHMATEGLIQSVHRAGAAMQTVGRVLGVLAPAEEVGDVI